MKLINQKIENIDISDIETIKLIANDYKTIQIKSENFYRIVKIILENTKKTSFEPNELESTYNYIIENYKTSLGEETYKKVQEVLSVFVKNGGKVEVTYKTMQNNPHENKIISVIYNTFTILISIFLGFLFLGIGFNLYNYNDIIAYIVWGVTGLIFFVIFNINKRTILNFFGTRLGILIIKIIMILLMILVILLGLVGIFLGGQGILDGPGTKSGFLIIGFFVGIIMFILGILFIYGGIKTIIYIKNKKY